MLVWTQPGKITIATVTIVGKGSFATEANQVHTFGTLDIFEIVAKESDDPERFSIGN